MKFGNLETELLEAFQVATKADVRALTIARLRFVTKAFAASIDRESEELKYFVRQNCNEYIAQVYQQQQQQQQVELAAKQPWIANVVKTNHISATALGYPWQQQQQQQQQQSSGTSLA